MSKIIANVIQTGTKAAKYQQNRAHNKGDVYQQSYMGQSHGQGHEHKLSSRGHRGSRGRGGSRGHQPSSYPRTYSSGYYPQGYPEDAAIPRQELQELPERYRDYNSAFNLVHKSAQSILDSGATAHLVNDLTFFRKL